MSYGRYRQVDNAPPSSSSGGGVIPNRGVGGQFPSSSYYSYVPEAADYTSIYVTEVVLGVIVSLLFDPRSLPLLIKAAIVGGASFGLPLICYNDPYHCSNVWPLSMIFESLPISNDPKSISFAIGFCFTCAMILYIVICYTLSFFMSVRYRGDIRTHQYIVASACFGMMLFLLFIAFFSEASPFTPDNDDPEEDDFVTEAAKTKGSQLMPMDRMVLMRKWWKMQKKVYLDHLFKDPLLYCGMWILMAAICILCLLGVYELRAAATHVSNKARKKHRKRSGGHKDTKRNKLLKMKRKAEAVRARRRRTTRKRTASNSRDTQSKEGGGRRKRRSQRAEGAGDEGAAVAVSLPDTPELTPWTGRSAETRQSEGIDKTPVSRKDREREANDSLLMDAKGKEEKAKERDRLDDSSDGESSPDDETSSSSSSSGSDSGSSASSSSSSSSSEESMDSGSDSGSSSNSDSDAEGGNGDGRNGSRTSSDSEVEGGGDAVSAQDAGRSTGAQIATVNGPSESSPAPAPTQTSDHPAAVAENNTNGSGGEANSNNAINVDGQEGGKGEQ